MVLIYLCLLSSLMAEAAVSLIRFCCGLEGQAKDDGFPAGKEKAELLSALSGNVVV